MVLDLRGVGGIVDLHLPNPADRDSWRAGHLRRLAGTDTLVVTLAALGAHLAGLAGEPPVPVFDLRAVALTIGVATGWSIVLGWNGSRAPHTVGAGGDEYRRLVSATLQLFGALAIAALLLRIETAQGYLVVALPAGLSGLVVTRALWRRHTARRRASGRYRRSVLVVGGPEAARAIAAALSEQDMYGYHVVGVCTPTGAALTEPATLRAGRRDIPIVGDDRSVRSAVRRTGADTVVVMATDRLGPRDIRRLAWDLDAFGTDLIVAPGVMDISGTRMSNQVLAGMPMLHIERPQYDRALSLGKAVFDLCFSTLILALISPLLLAIAVAVKSTSAGPVFYLSERIGMDGKPFRMVKFRSMYVRADREASALITAHGGNPLFFKLKNDPRVTPVGRFLRRYSLDELPQFFNVLARDMSVVGPRPQVRREVHSYDGVMRRRLLVRPGITGLWQVSGRSDLTPEESVEFDISYVENWSMLLDVRIIARTLRAVLRGDGAY
ncbi:sugar transferase [Nocardia carnea]|uniref:sugar transferase n=1 Tax=Nocardia carnea TaxID=37328 RepID=UPI00245736A1|nr:sugar transferase [Nocardia carnea]